MFKTAHVLYKPTQKCLAVAKAISEKLRSSGIRLIVATVDDLQKVGEKPDLIVSVGGDGTFLLAAGLVGETDDTLILPIPCGRRNILYEEEADDIDTVVQRLAAGDFYVESIHRLKIGVKGEERLFLNEAVLINTNLGKIMGIRIEIISPWVVSHYSFEGDGLLISTSKGSSAYNLSARGPLVAPLIHSIVLTPLNPIELNSPSSVLPAFSTVIKMTPIRGSLNIFVDGQFFKNVSKGTEVTVSGSTGFLRVIRFKPFADLIGSSIRWRCVGH